MKTQQVFSKPLSLRKLLISDEKLVPLKLNPLVTESFRLVEQFFQENELMFPQFKFVNDMGAYLHPNANLKRLTAIEILFDLDFYIDDLYGDHALNIHRLTSSPAIQETCDHIERCADVFATGKLSSNPSTLETGYWKLRKVMEIETTECWLERFAELLKEHLMATINPLAYGWVPDASISVDDYITIRELISGMHMTIDLIEFDLGIYLPNNVIYHAVVTKLRQCCMKIAALTNDLFSYEKEVLQGELTFNLIVVLQKNLRCGFEQAVEAAFNLINEETKAFYELSQNFVYCWDSTINSDVKHYIEGMKHQIAATWHWQMSTGRYCSPNSPFIELRKANCDLQHKINF